MCAVRALRMAGAVLVVLMLAAWSLSAPSKAGELIRDFVQSQALNRAMPVVVYVPSGYRSSSKKYPVLYLLHGAGGDENAWCDKGGLKTRADDLIERGIIPPTLIVMPGCPGCWWIDSPQGKAETAFFADLMPAIANRYRTIEERRGRVVAGLSAGGYGAVRFALKYPDRFAAAAAFSPAVYSETPPAMSAARSQLPFRATDGSFDQSRWAALNYPSLLPGYFQQTNRVPMFLVSGDNDQFGIAFETALLFKRLFDRQPAITELRVVDGDHTWDVWSAAFERAVPFLFKHAALPEPMVPAPNLGTEDPGAMVAMRRH